MISDVSQPEPEQDDPGELAARLADCLQQLPQTQRKVLALYYYEDLRLREIAEIFGLTESRICQIHAQAIVAIKALLQKEDSPGTPVALALNAK